MGYLFLLYPFCSPDFYTMRTTTTIELQQVEDLNLFTASGKGGDSKYALK